MNRLFLLLRWSALGLLTGLPLLLQAQADSIPPGRFRVYTYQGETYMAGELESIDITAPRPSARELRRGRRRLARFTRLRYNVHKVYPYAVKVAGVLAEVDLALQNLPDEEARKAYIKEREKGLFGEYEDDVRQMTRSQGKVLVKLVSRETGNSTFDLIKETKSGASAIFWQSIGLIFGINLKTTYDQEEEAMIEQIVQDLEQGGYNIAYKQYNYRLE
ncbi:MAG: DUF4294 domain-containing protein [Bacteroidetes bacterium]|nr:MAG: DUF4294 domain-containing protein [Bacteroidota bacterium]